MMLRRGSRAASIRLTTTSSATRSQRPNDRAGISRAYVLRRREGDTVELPRVLGFYTLSMALTEAAPIASVLNAKLPRYPMPVALIGRLAIHVRAQGRRLGEALLIDALRRVVDAAGLVGCTGIIVDAKDDAAERFYGKYDFVTITAETWPHRCFSRLQRRSRPSQNRSISDPGTRRAHFTWLVAAAKTPDRWLPGIWCYAVAGCSTRERRVPSIRPATSGSRTDGSSRSAAGSSAAASSTSRTCGSCRA